MVAVIFCLRDCFFNNFCFCYLMLLILVMGLSSRIFVPRLVCIFHNFVHLTVKPFNPPPTPPFFFRNVIFYYYQAECFVHRLVCSYHSFIHLTVKPSNNIPPFLFFFLFFRNIIFNYIKQNFCTQTFVLI